MPESVSNSIYLGADGKLSIREVTESYIPQGTQSLVRVQYSGVNLCDLNFFYVGLNSYITGFDLSGTVEQVGPDSPFNVGDIVCGISPVTFPKPSSVGTHQDLAIAESDLLFKVPAGLSLQDAGGLVLVAQTAADALFNALGFGFKAAGVSGADPNNIPLLIWGGASAVGSTAIQIAKAAGFGPIFATASPKNHEALRRLGATQCFDYKSPSVVDEIRAAANARGVAISTIFDTVAKGSMATGSEADQSSPALAAAVAEGSAGDIKLASTLPVAANPAFQMCTSYRPRGPVDAMGGPQDPESAARIRGVMDHLLSSIETTPKLPGLVVVKGAEAGIAEIERVARGNASFEKLVIEHPM